MRALESRLVRVMSERQILEITGTLPYATSTGLHWPGVEVHRYRVSGPSQTNEFRLPQLAIFLPHNHRPVRVSQQVGNDVATKDVANNAITIAPAALTRRVSIERPHELTAVFLDPLLFREIAYCKMGFCYPEIMPQFAITDPLVRSLGMTLDREMRCKSPKPSAYAERLALTLACHILMTYSTPVSSTMRRRGPQWVKLFRSIEHIHANMDRPMSLDQLAMLAGMSKFHFAKAFSEAVGIPPHRYLVQARIQRAKELLGDETMSVKRIALRVGYSDTGQFSAQFLKLMGVSPARYRRHARQS